MRASTTRQQRRKWAEYKPPVPPIPGFPLSPHATGCWCKKIAGKFHYFGRWARRVNGKLERIPGDGWEEALKLYKLQADDLHAGRTPRKTGDELTIINLCSRFLAAKLRQVEAGEIAAPTFTEYNKTTARLMRVFGKTRLIEDLAAGDFEVLRADMAKTFGPVRLGNEIQRVRTVFKYAYESHLTEQAMRFGPAFKKPSSLVMRRHRAAGGEKMFEAAELRRVLDALTGKKVETGRTDEKTGKPETVTLKANPVLRAMILLGVNAGFGNADCASLPLSALDLDHGWVRFPRPKTGIERRCPLWPETVEVLRAAIAQRPEPKQADAADLVFVTTHGRPWLSRGIANPVSVAARKVMKKVKIHREGIGFYTLRHVFRTIADGALYQVAANCIMGHSDHTMAAAYRERIDDSRLTAVSEHVRAWLWPEHASEETK
jgi:integrase